MTTPSPLIQVEEDWPYLLAFLPEDLEESARREEALVRRRNVPNAEALLRMALAYAVSDLSFKDVAAWAGGLGVATITGPGLFYRLRQAEGWLQHVLARVLEREVLDRPAGQTTRVTKAGGGLTTEVKTYEWDAMGRMTKAEVSAGSTTTATYDYNPSGDRVKRVEGAVTKLWSYAGHNIATAESSDNANVYSVYTVIGGGISNAVARHDVNASSNSTTSRYYQYNHRGDVVAALDSGGGFLYKYEYDAYGNVTTKWNSAGGDAPTDGILMTGKDYDEDTGLFYFNARWYDPETGVFLSSSDFPPEKEHPYAVSRGNPLSYVDPAGLFSGYPGLDLGPMSQSLRNAKDLWDCAQKAFDDAVRMAGEADPKGGRNRYNMRHCIAGCLMSQRCGGADIARFGQDFYESYTQFPERWTDPGYAKDRAQDDAAAYYGADKGEKCPGGNCGDMCAPWHSKFRSDAIDFLDFV